MNANTLARSMNPDALKKANQSQPVDHKAWAKRIIARKANGDRINPTVHAMAQRALGLEA